MPTPKQPYQVLKDLLAQPLPLESQAVAESSSPVFSSFTEALKDPDGNAAIQELMGEYWDRQAALGFISEDDAFYNKTLLDVNPDVLSPRVEKEAKSLWEATQRANEARAIDAEEKAKDIGKDDLEK